MAATGAWGSSRVWMAGNCQSQPTPRLVQLNTPLGSVGLSPEQTGYGKARLCRRAYAAAPSCVGPPPPTTPHIPGENVSPPLHHSGQPLPARSPLPGWTHCQAQSSNPSVVVVERGGEGAASTSCQGKTPAESFGGGYVCASLHGDSFVFGCKSGKRKRVSSNGEMKILCELVNMVLWKTELMGSHHRVGECV